MKRGSGGARGGAKPLAAWTALAAAAAAALSGLCWTRSGWAPALAGPVFVWWTGRLAVASGVLAVGDPRSWPRGRAGRWFAFGFAAAVGAWIGTARARELTLVILPLYAIMEQLALPGLVRPDARGSYIRLPVWIACVIAGEVCGFLAARALPMLRP